MTDCELTTTGAVIDALGGLQKVGELTGRTAGAVWNWTKFDHFPADTFLVMTTELERVGKVAPLNLWRMREPAERVAS